MNPEFARFIETLHPSFGRLLAMEPIRGKRFPKPMPKKGVYLFSESTNHLYVGRTKNIRRRYGRHCNPGATHRMAAFAFQMAREKTGNTKAAYKSGKESRDGLMQNQVFAAAFDAAKARIRDMDFRFVEETDPTRQALLEIYCAVALDTPYNDFDTH